MNENPQLLELANATAEAILRTIYGDDFAGCTVSLDSIATIIYESLAARSAGDRALLDLYEKTHEALAALTTPPANARDLAPNELRSLLGDRLDAVKTLVEKVSAVTAAAKTGQALPPE